MERREISLQGADFEFDKDNELCVNFDEPSHFFYLNEQNTIALRDFLIAATARDTKVEQV